MTLVRTKKAGKSWDALPFSMPYVSRGAQQSTPLGIEAARSRVSSGPSRPTYMPQTNRRKRREFKWSQAARDAVRANLNASGTERRILIRRIARETGNPYDSCLRFARKLGLTSKRPYRSWTLREQKELPQFIRDFPSINEVAKKFERSPAAIYGMLRRLGATPTIRKDSLTLYGLAKLLHIRPHRVREWIEAGSLKARREGTEKLPRLIIELEDFAAFCKTHRAELLKRRVTPDRLEFIFKFVYPPSHTELLPVRESMREQAAYESQLAQHGGQEEQAS